MKETILIWMCIAILFVCMLFSISVNTFQSETIRDNQGAIDNNAYLIRENVKLVDEVVETMKVLHDNTY